MKRVFLFGAIGLLLPLQLAFSQDLYPINLLNNQKWKVEVTPEKNTHIDVQYFFEISRHGDTFNILDYEIDLKTGQKQEGFGDYEASFIKQYTADRNYLEFRHCWYKYPSIHEGFSCMYFRIPVEISEKTVKGDQDYSSLMMGAYQDFEVVILEKSSQEVNCNIRAETYEGQKIYFTKASSEFKDLGTCVCFESEADAEKAGYRLNFAEGGTPEPSPTKEASTPALPPEPAEANGDAPEDSKNGEAVIKARVASIDDGDTFTVQINGENEKVKLLGLNAPEMNACSGDQAKSLLSALILNKEITLLRNARNDNRDASGRLFRTAKFKGRVDMAILLLITGNAAVSEEGGQANPLYQKLENRARMLKRGIWGECDGLPLEAKATPRATPKPQATPTPVPASPSQTPRPAATSTPKSPPNDLNVQSISITDYWTSWDSDAEDDGFVLQPFFDDVKGEQVYPGTGDWSVTVEVYGTELDPDTYKRLKVGAPVTLTFQDAQVLLESTLRTPYVRIPDEKLPYSSDWYIVEATFTSPSYGSFSAIVEVPDWRNE